MRTLTLILLLCVAPTAAFAGFIPPTESMASCPSLQPDFSITLGFSKAELGSVDKLVDNLSEKFSRNSMAKILLENPSVRIELDRADIARKQVELRVFFDSMNNRVYTIDAKQEIQEQIVALLSTSGDVTFVGASPVYRPR